MRVAVVANPTAGRGKAAKLIPRVDALLRSAGVEHTMLVSQGPDDPERLARDAAGSGTEIVAALGGDGQVGLVANGVVGTDAAVAVIPAGMGNDFARHIGLDRKDPLAATRLLADPLIKAIDLGLVRTLERERHYVNVGGAGFDSEVNAYANTITLLRGTPRYVYSMLITLSRFRAGRFTITVDGTQHAFPAMLVAVGNGSSYGGGMRVTPEASLEDGILDVCVVGELSKVSFVRAFPKVFSGRHTAHPAVTMLRGAEVRVAADRTFQVFADGEPVGTTPATFEVIPLGLRLVTPR